MYIFCLENKASTDSIGSRNSDHSGTTQIVSPQRPKVDVAFVIDLQNPINIAQRKQACEDVKNACLSLNANFHHVQVLRQYIFREKRIEMTYAVKM